MEVELILAIIGAISGLSGVGSFILGYYRYIYKPRRTPRPRIVYDADHYFITENLASHDFLIRNEGNAPAKDVKLYIALLPRFKIINITSSPPPDHIIDGEKHSSVELHWEQILPGKIVFTRIISEADKKEPQTVFPVEFRIWYERGIVSAYEAHPRQS